MRIERQQQPDDSWIYPVVDALGSVRGVVDEGLFPLESRQYAPYGEVFASAGTQQTAYGFTGQPSGANGLLHLRNRYFDPTVGRFLSMDRLDMVHRYAYASSNPLNRVDPLGLFDWLSSMVEAGDSLACIAREAGKMRLDEYNPSVIMEVVNYHNKHRGSDRFIDHPAFDPSNPNQLLAAYKLALPPSWQRKQGICDCPASSHRGECSTYTPPTPEDFLSSDGCFSSTPGRYPPVRCAEGYVRRGSLCVPVHRISNACQNFLDVVSRLDDPHNIREWEQNPQVWEAWTKCAETNEFEWTSHCSGLDAETKIDLFSLLLSLTNIEEPAFSWLSLSVDTSEAVINGDPVAQLPTMLLAGVALVVNAPVSILVAAFTTIYSFASTIGSLYCTMNWHRR